MHADTITTRLLQQLQSYQAEAVSLCQSAGQNYNVQHHPDLSPVGWHLGHCIFTESYWIHEKFLSDDNCDADLHKLYNPANSAKQERGYALPSREKLCQWAEYTQRKNRGSLEKNKDYQDPLQLMENNFLLHFLIQHYAQHLETMRMAFAQAERIHKSRPVACREFVSSHKKPVTIPLPAGEYHVGAQQEGLPYDNEYPSHNTELPGCLIMQQPVSNASYLRFMECGGYDDKAYWSKPGWQWQQDKQVKNPAYWCRDMENNWTQVGRHGHKSLEAEDPVYGLSYYEAEAFANWAGGRLPHEHEWEAAFEKGLLQNTGHVWEWCRNSFYPYPGFCAYPYDGYSVPYFDGHHFTLKGGSILTEPVIKRRGFRNYYQADKNFLFAGIRLVFDDAEDH